MLPVPRRACARAAVVVGLAAGALLSPAAAHAASAGGGATVWGSPHATATTRSTTSSRDRLGSRVLREGMHGPDVRQLQQALTAAGYRTTADGQFGPLTRASLIGWQHATGVPATGVLSRREASMLHTARATTATAGPAGADEATIDATGQLVLPAGAPAAVQEIVTAANDIIDTPYEWGGGHASWTSAGYDCSGAVSFALHGAGLLPSPEDSTGLETFGEAGAGRWVTVYADAAHAFLVVDGRAFDTADYGGPDIPSGSGPRWRTSPTGNLADGGAYVVRHPPGL